MAFFYYLKCKMQNRQASTRGLSAGDWTRIKRIQNATPAASSTGQDIQVSVSDNAPPTNSAGATAFVLACIDPRYASALESFLSKELAQPGFFTYDLFILAGASLGGTLTGSGTPNGPPNTNGLCTVVSASTNWRSTLLDHIQAAITLHNVTEFYVIDHLDCGAFKNCANAGDDLIPGPHSDQYDGLKAIIDAELFYPNGGGAKVAGSTIFPTWTGLYFDIPVNSLTSLRDYPTNTEQQVEVFPPNTSAKVLVLGCIDPRFNALLTSFLVNFKNVEFVYDLFILAGSSLGVNQSYNTNGTLRANGTTGTAYPNNSLAENPGRSGVGPLGRYWGPTFFDHLSIARLLHNITQVWVFDHLDCGAYKLIKLNDGTAPLVLPSDNDPAPHIVEIRKLQERISAYTSTPDHLNNAPTILGFKGFVMDMSGNITQVVESNPTSSSPLVFGSSRIRNPASDYTDIVARRSADFVTQSQNPTSCTRSLTVTRLCSCTPTTLNTKLANCASCKNGILH